MRASKMLLATLKEAPNEAIISSHILLIRAGMIRKLVAGVYNYLPLGLRSLRKIENIVREEMDKSGALEILSSAIQPKELWEQSGRWFKYGPELMRFKDRHNRDFCLGPTHEEIFTDLIKNEIKSYKALPINVYQIQTKYRDELRPRFGLMRGREFIMKDSYSFDIDEKGLDASYQIMYQTYERIFTRLHLKYKIVLADTGAIGGSGSHQFMALSDVGESKIIYCDNCHYAADEEKADSATVSFNENEKEEKNEKVYTPNIKTIDELTSYLNIPAQRTLKAVAFKANKEVVIVFVRGDREVNTIKVCNALNVAEHELEIANNDDLLKYGIHEGFIGPVDLKCRILIDEEATLTKNMVVGANLENYHLKNVNFNRDFKAEIFNLKDAKEGDLCPICKKPLKSEKGIEVGQIFKLKTKYSEPLQCTYLDQNGKTKPMVMGCYGIGITRTMSSIIEQNHDENGIIWPLNVAPYHCVIIPVNYADENQKKVADEIYQTLLKHNVEVVLDDRDAKVGFKFKDWDLIGLPMQIVVGKKANENIVEFKYRKDNQKIEKKVEEVIKEVIETVNKEA